MSSAQMFSCAQPKGTAGGQPVNKHKRRGGGIPRTEFGVIDRCLAQNGTRHGSSFRFSYLNEPVQGLGKCLALTFQKKAQYPKHAARFRLIWLNELSDSYLRQRSA